MIDAVLSVIIPTYNRREYLPAALRSVLDQAPAETEVLVLDDDSDDGTGQLVVSLTDPRIRYSYGEKRGISASRNRGLDQCQGQFIAFLDSDDTWYPGRVERQLPYLQAHPQVDLIYEPTSKPLRVSSRDWLIRWRVSSERTR